MEAPLRNSRYIKGRRQGDPLSPFIFILVMEGLEDVVESHLIQGLSIGVLTFRLSHLLYAENIILLTDWDQV